MKSVAIILAAGSGSRMNIIGNKLLYEVLGRPVICRTLEAFQKSEYIDGIVLVVSDKALFGPYLNDFSKLIHVVIGGKTRAESVRCGLAYADGFDIVAVHDGDRPFVSQRIISETVKAAETHGAAVPCVPLKDTVKKFSGNEIAETLKRTELCAAQTPQTFRRQLLQKAYEGDISDATDDASLVEKTHKVFLTGGSEYNIKLTTQFDLETAELIAKNIGGDEF